MNVRICSWIAYPSMDGDRGREASKSWLTDTSRDPGLSADHVVELCET